MMEQPRMLDLGESWINLNAVTAVKFKPDEVMVWMVGEDSDPWCFTLKQGRLIRQALTRFLEVTE